MSAVEDFSRYLDTQPMRERRCCCGHHAAHHLDYTDACLHWHEDGCMAFEEDTGKPTPSSVLTPPPGGGYSGIYQGKKWPA